MPPRRRRGELRSYADVFAIDLNAALLLQLPAKLNELRPVALTEANLEVLGPEHGVYQLFHQGRSVYFGKSQETLRTRLLQHRRRCMGRLGINVSDMSFRCLYVDKFVDAASPESVLIRRYREEGDADWNIAEGFAPKDVGRGRPNGKPGQWFIDRPVDYRVEVAVPAAGRDLPLIDALEALKGAVPFDLFRFASVRSKHSRDLESIVDYDDRFVNLVPGPAPVMDHLCRIVEALPSGWQATITPVGVTVYREHVDYDYAICGLRRERDGVVQFGRGIALPHSPLYP